MSSLPHIYCVTTTAGTDTNLRVEARGLPDLEVAAPPQFGGPGDCWSPEQLLVSAVSSCLILSFRALLPASGLKWRTLACETRGELDKVERRLRFTRIETRARLTLAPGEDVEQARSLLTKAKDICLISNSLSAETHLDIELLVADA